MAHTQDTHRAHTGHAQGTHGAHMRHTQSTHRAHCWGTHRAHCWGTHRVRTGHTGGTQAVALQASAPRERPPPASSPAPPVMKMTGNGTLHGGSTVPRAAGLARQSETRGPLVRPRTAGTETPGATKTQFPAASLTGGETESSRAADLARWSGPGARDARPAGQGLPADRGDNAPSHLRPGQACPGGWPGAPQD